MKMTNEEAIKMLKSKMDGNTDTSYEWAETVRMAIKALEQQLCEDCISREEVIDEINRMGINAFKTYNDYSELFDFVDALPSVTPQQARWIPVSERLPEENIHVLCQFYMGGMAECYHAHDYWHIVGGFRIKIDDVLAWMPLPEPYKEGDE